MVPDCDRYEYIYINICNYIYPDNVYVLSTMLFLYIVVLLGNAVISSAGFGLFWVSTIVLVFVHYL